MVFRPLLLLAVLAGLTASERRVSLSVAPDSVCRYLTRAWVASPASFGGLDPGLPQTFSCHPSPAPVNQSPVVGVIADRGAAAGTTIGPIVLSLSDDQTAVGDLLLSATSSDQGIISDAGLGLSALGDQWRLTLTLEPGAIGSTEVTVSASDGERSGQTGFRVTSFRPPPSLVVENIDGIIATGVQPGVAVEVTWTVEHAVGDIDSQALRWGYGSDSLVRRGSEPSARDDGSYSARLVPNRGGVDALVQVEAIVAGDVLVSGVYVVEVVPTEGHATLAMSSPFDGSFTMGDHQGYGDADELPVHPVVLSSFSASRFEVTNAQFVEVMNWGLDNNHFMRLSGSTLSHGSTTLMLVGANADMVQVNGRLGAATGRDDRPVHGLTWYGALAWCALLNEREGLPQAVDTDTWTQSITVDDGYRLPTEAEWEFIARGALTGKAYPWGDQQPVSSRANFFNFVGATVAVGSYAANGLLIYDAAGNVSEWCADHYGADWYTQTTTSDPIGPGAGGSRLVRGGAWHNSSKHLRCSEREAREPSYSSPQIGFRPVRSR